MLLQPQIQMTHSSGFSNASRKLNFWRFGLRALTLPTLFAGSSPGPQGSG
jgi:hypothetical protein